MSRLKTLLLEHTPTLTIPKPPIQEFHRFPDLPKELRVEIWKLAAMEPRRIHPGLHIRHPEFLEDGLQTGSIPAVIQATRESRCEGLKYYKLYSRPMLRNRKKTCAIYLNFTADIFVHEQECFKHLCLLGYSFDEYVARNIQHLEIRHSSSLLNCWLRDPDRPCFSTSSCRSLRQLLTSNQYRSLTVTQVGYDNLGDGATDFCVYRHGERIRNLWVDLLARRKAKTNLSTPSTLIPVEITGIESVSAISIPIQYATLFR